MAATSEDTRPSGTTPRGDGARAGLHPVVTEHQIIGTQTGRQGAGQVVPEDSVLCAKCGWMRCSDYTWHLSDALTAAGRAETTTEDATQRLARAAFAVDSKHHFHEGSDGRPACSCGFVGDARKRTQTEHITAAVLEEYDHD